MTKLAPAITLETAFDTYSLDEQIGEGGAGTVYGAKASDGRSVAIKILSKSDTDKRKRFKNETAFLLKTDHPNIVKVVDFGLAATGKLQGPFYVMQRYEGSLRGLMKRRLATSDVMPLFSQILNGVEAAHLKEAKHRDLKPENVLVSHEGAKLAIADFGIASFVDAAQVTTVETKPTTRLANFQYAAPEQRVAGREVGYPADIYALGLILNEMFTTEVPHGADYKTIGAVAREFGYLDAIVSKMIQQDPKGRLQSIAIIKAQIQKYQAEAVSQQKISAIDGAVVREGEIDNALAFDPPFVISGRHDGRQLILTLDRDTNSAWVEVLRYRLGNFRSAYSASPDRWSFVKNEAFVPVLEGDISHAIECFKEWLPKATATLRYELEVSMKQKRKLELDKLQRERDEEERVARINRSIKI
jgi:serine/threonine protein kinase